MLFAGVGLVLLFLFAFFRLSSLEGHRLDFLRIYDSSPSRGVGVGANGFWRPALDQFRFFPIPAVGACQTFAYICLGALFFQNKTRNISLQVTFPQRHNYGDTHAFMVSLQPDMGTAGVLVFVWISMLLISGLRAKFIAYGALRAGANRAGSLVAFKRLSKTAHTDFFGAGKRCAWVGIQRCPIQNCGWFRRFLGQRD